jgi:CRP/FNR family transcriptional regulator
LLQQQKERRNLRREQLVEKGYDVENIGRILDSEFSELEEEEVKSLHEKFANVENFKNILLTDFEKVLQQNPSVAISFTKLVGLKLKQLESRYNNLVFDFPNV